MMCVAGKERQIALDEFYEEWKDDSLVILKWLGLQTASNVKSNLQNVQQLLKHPAVNITNPNTCYSVFLGFARSPVNFHAEDGSGYKFMADSTLEVSMLGCSTAVDPETALLDANSAIDLTEASWKCCDAAAKCCRAHHHDLATWWLLSSTAPNTMLKVWYLSGVSRCSVHLHCLS